MVNLPNFYTNFCPYSVFSTIDTIQPLYDECNAYMVGWDGMNSTNDVNDNNNNNNDLLIINL